ncbi:MAG: MFS transporter [Planctomycetota bacterium]
MSPLRLAAITLLAASSLTVMSGATIAPALPAIRDAYADGWQADLLSKLVLTLPALLIALIAPIGGRLLNRLGRRRTLFAGLVFYAVAGSSGLWVPESWTLLGLLGGRAALGAAVAMVMVSATTLIGDYFSGEQRRGLLGVQSACMAGGGVAFLLLGGVLADVDWRLPFAVYLLSLLLVPMALMLPEPDRSDDRQERTEGSVLAVLPVYLIAFGFMVAFYLAPTQLPFLVEAILAHGPEAGGLLSGSAIAASTATGVVTGLAYGKLRPRLGLHGVNASASGLMAIGFAMVWCSSFLGHGWLPAYAMVLGGMGVFGLGSGAFMPNLNNWLLDVVPESSRGRAVGILTASFFLGQFLSPAVMEPVVGATSIPAAFGIAGAILGVGAVLVVIITPSLRRRLGGHRGGTRCGYQDPLGPCPRIDDR